MKELYAALLKAKRNISPPQKNRKAMYGRYADLDAVLTAVEGPLAAENLVISQSVVQNDTGSNFLRTSLYHTETGQGISSDVPLVSKDLNDPQKLGGSITYARRYGITALLSIVADDDDDGNTSAGKSRDGSKPQGRPPGKGVSQERIQEVFSVERSIPNNIVEALVGEFKRADFSDSQIVPEIRALLGRDFGHLPQLTEAEARTAVGHARKVKRGDAERLS